MGHSYNCKETIFITQKRVIKETWFNIKQMSNNIESARKELKISGYVHPTDIVPKTVTQYKTFNTESKGENYGNSKHKSGYATFTDNEYTDNYAKGCPDCGNDALYECDCVLKDKQGSNGHVWYTDKSGHIKRGDPHENE